MARSGPPPAVILAAGRGTRLGLDMPKCLVRFGDGTILSHQLANFARAGVQDVLVVVGFKADRVRRQRAPAGVTVRYVENAAYMDTQTSKSLLAAVEELEDEAFLQVNGDVVFDWEILPKMLKRPDVTKLAAREGAVGEEEIKYVLHDGRVVDLGKKVQGGAGEAVGLNYFAAADVALLERALRYVPPNAYFERAIEHMLPFTKNPIECVPLGRLRAVEIDFNEDLVAAQDLFGVRPPAEGPRPPRET